DFAGEAVADLDDGPGKGLHALGFLGDSAELLVAHERAGRAELLVWSPLTGAVRELALPLDGELSAVAAPDGSWLLVTCEQRGRTTLHRVALPDLTITPVEVPAGVVDGVEVRPDDQVWYAWSCAAAPPSIRDGSGAEVVPRAGRPAPPSVAVSDVLSPGPGGEVHSFLRVPPDGVGPHAAVFLAHGGPTWNDSDSWHVRAAAWVDAGYAVVMVNYRGSTGYGSAWRDAIDQSPGFIELADIAAVRDHLVADGVIDPARCVLSGGSWGGFLTLLGLGTQPQLWAAGSAAVPVADYVAAFEDEMEGLKAFDRSLFGGSPAEVPDAYRKASPLTYVDQVRAPVLILAGANDPRCPIRQIENYLTALAGLDKDHEVYRFDAGHGSFVAEERIRQMAAELAFVRRHVPA
ncbi:MAG TPA: prolyl oligopeptidase family serine peptidase, partial [Mycobacteriales bacterium]|nr:prolyl oligopeptidase family serine peptidase [Mycobacteriales bacterium]